MITNRITGPGYYPKRPTRVLSCTFEGDVCYLYLYAADGTQVGHVPWLGSGRYHHHAAYVDGVVTTWMLVDRFGIALVTKRCPPQPTIGFEIDLINSNPSTAPDERTHWTFTPARSTP